MYDENIIVKNIIIVLINEDYVVVKEKEMFKVDIEVNIIVDDY